MVGVFLGGGKGGEKGEAGVHKPYSHQERRPLFRLVGGIHAFLFVDLFGLDDSFGSGAKRRRPRFKKSSVL